MSKGVLRGNRTVVAEVLEREEREGEDVGIKKDCQGLIMVYCNGS